MKKEIGVALGGGGVPGICVHAGFIDAIRERYEIVEIAGTSAGAIIAAAHALHPGCCLKDLVLDLLVGKTIVDGGAIHFGLHGAWFSNEHLSAMLDKLVGTRPVTHIPLSITTANLSRRCQSISGWGKDEHPRPSDLRDTILASAAVPVLLPPVRLDGDLHVDGGIVQNLPLDSLSVENRVGAYFPDNAGLGDGIVGYIEALIGTIVNGNVLDEIDEAVNVDIVPLKKVGALLPESISIEDAHHLCMTGYNIGRDYLRGHV